VTEAEEAEIPEDLVQDGMVSLPALIVGLGMAASNGKAKELISSGAVTLAGEKLSELRMSQLDLLGKVLKVGKHQFKTLV
jgi:tyrosyl-tRNA synthetase